MLSRPFRSSFLCLLHQSFFSAFFVCLFCHLFLSSPHQYLPVLDCLSSVCYFLFIWQFVSLFIIFVFPYLFSSLCASVSPHHLTVSFCLCGVFLLLFFLLCSVSKLSLLLTLGVTNLLSVPHFLCHLCSLSTHGSIPVNLFLFIFIG